MTQNLRPISEAWDWQTLGSCRERSGTQYFHPDDDLGRISRRLREHAACDVCRGCPVRAQCAGHALSVGEEYGVWGGFTENDRMVLQKLGWKDTAGPGNVVDVGALDRRLASARAGVARLAPAAAMAEPRRG